MHEFDDFTGKKEPKQKNFKFFGSWFLVYHPSDLSSTTSLFPRRSLSLEARIVVEHYALGYEQLSHRPPALA
jgi:hypothetical protein